MSELPEWVEDLVRSMPIEVVESLNVRVQAALAEADAKQAEQRARRRYTVTTLARNIVSQNHELVYSPYVSSGNLLALAHAVTDGVLGLGNTKELEQWLEGPRSFGDVFVGMVVNGAMREVSLNDDGYCAAHFIVTVLPEAK
jgi:hypothetical protein